jgi:hypothetical protein
MKITHFAFLITLLIFSSCSNGSSRREVGTTPSNGDLNNTFAKEPEITPEQKLQQEKNKLLAEGWTEEYIPNGQFASCYNFSPKKGKKDNYLEVYVGGGTDVAIKIMNIDTDQCVRYVFINSGSTYRINNIPEGRYYLKIAYGKNWLSKVESGQCIGKFIHNPMYEKGNDVLDFNIKYTAEGYNIPSFQLQLDVVSSGISNSFSSQNISETAFNQ